MARARNIKPGFLTNDVLAECHPLARILFAGLWCHADREGRLEDRPRKLKAEILPYDDCDVEEFLCQLATRAFILRYEAGGIKYIQVLNFSKHQNPHVKEAPSSIPAPIEHQASTVQEQFKQQPEPERAGLIPDSPIPITDSGLLIVESAPPAVAAAAPKKSKKPTLIPLPDDFCISERVQTWAVEKGITNLPAHLEHFIGACRAKGYMYANWDDGFMGAIRNDWAKIGYQARGSPGGSQLGKAGQETAQAAQRLREKMRLEHEPTN